MLLSVLSVRSLGNVYVVYSEIGERDREKEKEKARRKILEKQARTREKWRRLHGGVTHIFKLTDNN